MLSRSIFLAYFKVASRNMYSFSEIFPLTLLFGHPYTFIRNQKKVPPTPLNGVIWSYTLIKFSDFVLLTLLFRLILYSLVVHYCKNTVWSISSVNRYVVNIGQKRIKSKSHLKIIVGATSACCSLGSGISRDTKNEINS